MPYLSAERVAEIRTQLKKEFPDYKFSVTRSNHSGVSVSVLSAPFNLLRDASRTYEQINQFYIHDNYKEMPEAAAVLGKMYAIINSGNRTVSEDGDYGSIPAFYVTMSVGSFDKPFLVVDKQPTAQPTQDKSEVNGTEKVEVQAGEVQIIDYSEKAFAVIGDTYPIKEQLKQLGGKFNRFLKCGAGWIFSKSKLEEVQAALMPQEEQEPTTLRQEVEKTIEFFAETDVKLYGEVQPSTIEAARVQDVEVKEYATISDIFPDDFLRMKIDVYDKMILTDDVETKAFLSRSTLK